MVYDVRKRNRNVAPKIDQTYMLSTSARGVQRDGKREGKKEEREWVFGVGTKPKQQINCHS